MSTEVECCDVVQSDSTSSGGDSVTAQYFVPFPLFASPNSLSDRPVPASAALTAGLNKGPVPRGYETEAGGLSVPGRFCRSYKGRLVVRQVNPADWPYPPEPEL